MDLEAVIALAGAFGLGSLLGVALRAEHERAERRRDRMIAAAEEFIRLVEEARVALNTAHLKVDVHHGLAVRRASQAEVLAGSEEEFRASASAARDAIRAVYAAIERAEGVVPRISLLFPFRSDRSELAPGFAVTNSLRKPLGLLELGMSSGIQRESLLRALGALGEAHGAFIRYAHDEIWHRWYGRLVQKCTLVCRRAWGVAVRRLSPSKARPDERIPRPLADDSGEPTA